MSLHFLADASTVHNWGWPMIQQTFESMFHNDLPWLEKMLRPIFVYFFLIIGLRVAGKRELAQLNPFDLIVLLTLSNTVQNAIIGSDNTVSGGMIGAATLLVINYLVVRFVHKYRRIEHLLEGDAEILVSDGKMDDKLCEGELISRPELEAAAHRQGIASLDDVSKAILEPTGTLNFIPRSPTPDQARHDQIVDLIEQLRKEITEIRAARPS